MYGARICYFNLPAKVGGVDSRWFEPQGVRSFAFQHHCEIASKSHPIICPVSNRACLKQSGHRVNMNIYRSLEQKLRICGATALLLNVSTWHGALKQTTTWLEKVKW